MNVSQIIKSIQKVVNDPTILKQEILDQINRRQREISSIVCLPDLIETDTVTVEPGDSSVAMPATFQHHLLEAYSTTRSQRITIRTNSKSLNADHAYGEDSGDIEECAVDGRTLVVVPEAGADEDLQLRYYRYPVDLSENLDDADPPDEPDGIPEEYHRKLLVSGVIVNLLPLTDMDPAERNRALNEHQQIFSAGLTEISKRFAYAAKSTPKPRRMVMEF